MSIFKKMKARFNRGTRNGLLIGFGSVLNIFPVYSNTNLKFCQSDTKVLKSDWKSIGGDFNEAIKKVKKKQSL